MAELQNPVVARAWSRAYCKQQEMSSIRPTTYKEAETGLGYLRRSYFPVRAADAGESGFRAQLAYRPQRASAINISVESHSRFLPSCRLPGLIVH